jgi:hypothetical protein
MLAAYQGIALRKATACDAAVRYQGVTLAMTQKAATFTWARMVLFQPRQNELTDLL